MMKRKGQVPIVEHVEKPIKKKTTSKVKETQKMLQWIKMNANEFKWAKRVGLENLITL
jgi:uncharacterized protein YdaL